jgi:RNA polymerase sigma-70 factor, ECF subfamily
MGPAARSDDDLRMPLEAAAHGDDVALADLVRRTQPLVWRVCTALGSPGLEEDLVQETYLRAVRAFGQLVPDSNLKSWLFVIMRNIWLNQIRHAHSRPTFVGLEPEEEGPAEWLDSKGNDPHTALVRKLKREEVRAAIESLPQLYGEIVVLRVIEGFSYQQIANVLQCPVGTVMSRLGRARQKLRSLLGQWRPEAAHRKI